MGYDCGSGCGGGYCCNSGIEQIVTYARPSFDYSQDMAGFDPHYQAKAMMSESVSTPSYIDNIDRAIGNASYVISTGHEEMEGGAFNFSHEKDDDLYKKKKEEENKLSSNYNNNLPTTENGVTTTRPFVNPWIKTKFIGDAEEIKSFVEQTFESVVGKPLPSNITIEVCDDQRFVELHRHFGGKPTQGIQGFAINRKHEGGLNHVVVRKGELAHVMLVIGHEIGHLMSTTLLNKHDEEAKAYAFEMAWLKAIYENDVGGLRHAINIDGDPAKNGLHDVAFEFVQGLLRSGNDAIDVVERLINGEIRVNSSL